MPAAPEFKPEAAQVWSSVALTAILVFISTYTSWVSSALGASAAFHVTHGISGSWAGLCGIMVSLLGTILAWRGFGLNAVAALIGSASLSISLIGSDILKPSISMILAVSWLVAVIYFTRKYYEGNAFKTFIALWGLSLASSVSQSVFYKYAFNHSYPLEGVLLLKLFLFVLGGLMILFIIPRKNEEYVL